MPILKWFPPQGPPRSFVLHKPVTTVGLALGNDVAVAGEGLAETHAQVLFDGRDFNLEEVDRQADILVNGKKKRRARLVHGDRITLGNVDLAFSMFDEPPKLGTSAGDGAGGPPGTFGALTQTQLNVTNQQLAAFRKLYEFSEKLMTLTDIDPLLGAMLDAVIDVTGAEKGLILLNDDAFTTTAPKTPESNGARRASVRAARNVKREAVA
ncbi:MAG TPA: FHA domain-containing protein, partial [Polyangiaceae bacterium]|nr:FHA domain-containing protein [Polyangiaceae bacterium]